MNNFTLSSSEGAELVISLKTKEKSDSCCYFDRKPYIGLIAMIPWPVGRRVLYIYTYMGHECRSAAVEIMQSRIYSSVYIFSAPLGIKEVSGLG